VPKSPTRGLITGLTAGLLGGGAVAWHARHRAPHQVILKHLRIGDPLTSGTDLRIGFVTDTHVGPTMNAADLDRAMQLIMAEEPDLLLLGGDYVSESPRYLPETADVIGAYASAAPLGTFAVFGNHDYANDAPRMERLLSSKGVRVLRNEAAHLGGPRLWIAGIDDAILSTPDVARTFEAVPENAPVVALWHEPDGADEVARYGAMLQLSGHSHGGQVRLPGIGHISTPPGGRRYVSGLNNASGMPVYTSHGVGAYRPPVRYRCAPEVTLVSLHLPPDQLGELSREARPGGNE
jgi:predicted MPP superfamily phosphohydrolase